MSAWLVYQPLRQILQMLTQLARQYRTEHGTPITAGQLAARLKK